MGLWKESKEKVENEKKAMINREMSKKRVLEKRDLTQSEINKIKREVEQEYKRARALRKRIAYFVAGALSIVGVTVGGHALLNSGDEVPKENKTAIESTANTEQETTKQEKSARDAYLEELQEYNTEVTFETQNEENIVEEILESYNANLETSEKIDKDNLGIIQQEDMGEGHFLKTISEDGTVSYEEVLIKTDDDRQELVDIEKCTEVESWQFINPEDCRRPRGQQQLTMRFKLEVGGTLQVICKDSASGRVLLNEKTDVLYEGNYCVCKS